MKRTTCRRTGAVGVARSCCDAQTFFLACTSKCLGPYCFFLLTSTSRNWNLAPVLEELDLEAVFMGNMMIGLTLWFPGRAAEQLIDKSACSSLMPCRDSGRTGTIKEHFHLYRHPKAKSCDPSMAVN